MIDDDPKGAGPARSLQTEFHRFDVATDSVADDDAPAPASAGPLPDANARYDVRGLLGRGGMGEVRLCTDRRMGREVATKIALPRMMHDETAKARFLREARVQGQLEHPSVVPVYDLKILEDDSAYFTMKRVRGMTLADILAGLARGDDGMEERFSRHRLLSIFSAICLGVEFAHSRGVVHRDLKPDNVMVGNFGEVYVLDWGLAHLYRDGTPASAAPEALTVDDVETLSGTVMGTPGYMAPEQLSSTFGTIGPRTDVYALGAILFEILTLAPLVIREAVAGMLVTTMTGVNVDERLIAAGVNVPPELASLCAGALAKHSDKRSESARALSETVSAYLEGDRDLERRRALATQHAARADALLAQDDDESSRTDAMRELGRALALDPELASARRNIVRLMLEPPTSVPDQVKRRLAARHGELTRLGGLTNARLSLVWLIAVPLALWMGVRSPTSMVLPFIPLLGSALVSWWFCRKAVPPRWVQVLVYVSMTLGHLAIGRAFGPLMVVPCLLAVFAVATQTDPDPRMRRLSIGLFATVLVGGVGLEYVGVLPESYAFVEGGLLIRPQMLDFDKTSTTVGLLVGFLGVGIGASLFVARLREQLTEAETRLHLQAWHLERLLPPDDVADVAGVEPGQHPKAAA